MMRKRYTHSRSNLRRRIIENYINRPVPPRPSPSPEQKCEQTVGNRTQKCSIAGCGHIFFPKAEGAKSPRNTKKAVRKQNILCSAFCWNGTFYRCVAEREEKHNIFLRRHPTSLYCYMLTRVLHCGRCSFKQATPAPPTVAGQQTKVC